MTLNDLHRRDGRSNSRPFKAMTVIFTDFSSQNNTVFGNI